MQRVFLIVAYLFNHFDLTYQFLNNSTYNREGWEKEGRSQVP